METFTLILWLMMGDRFEEVRVVDMTRWNCHHQLMVIRADQHRGPVKAQCLGRYPPTICAHGICGRELPSEIKRVELVPHICGFGGCFPIYGGPGNTLMPVRD